MRAIANAILAAVGLPLAVVLLVTGAILWARARDPFLRVWTTAETPHYGTVKMVAVTPRTASGRLPGVLLLSGPGTGTEHGKDLRQIAEMGFAVVGMDYDEGNENVFAAQFRAADTFLRYQPFVDTNRIAWIGCGAGAANVLRAARSYRESEISLLIYTDCKSGRDLPGAGDKVAQPEAMIVECRPNNRALASSSHDVPLDTPSPKLPEIRCLSCSSAQLGNSRQLLLRELAEYRLVRLKGFNAFKDYRSNLNFEAAARSFGWYCAPALLCGILWVRGKHHACACIARIEHKHAWSEMGKLAKVQRWRAKLKALVFLCTITALADAALHVFVPLLPVSQRTLAFAIAHLTTPKSASDLLHIARFPAAKGIPLKTLLQHAEIASYNRDLVAWHVDDPVYQDFVLSPDVDERFNGALKWRQELWEALYPRVKNNIDLLQAADAVVEFLRERVTIDLGRAAVNGATPVSAGTSVEEVWRNQLGSGPGFEALYVAALRAVGIPARLDASTRAQILINGFWSPAPRPLLETLL